jgi:ubiquinone/menaquinone biosynthesis C-methylase UbiE
MEIRVDADKTLKYETPSPGRKVFNAFFVPLVSIVPKKTKKFIEKSHQSAEHVINHATTHVALEILYKNGIREHTKSFLQKVAHWVWFGTNNSKSVRNRLRIVKRELRKNIIRLFQEKEAIKILSIASGSARAIVETIQENPQIESEIYVSFLDKNPAALDYSKDMVNRSGLQNSNKLKFEWTNGTAGTFLTNLAESGDKFDIIEMVGLLDYFDDIKTEQVFKKIYSILNENGVLITANINHNSEKQFLNRIIEWPMIYRTAEDLGSLLIKGGFYTNKIHLYYEPLKVHSVAVAIK